MKKKKVKKPIPKKEYKLKHKIVGRPLKIKTIEELRSTINKYFDDCATFPFTPLTITGLALALHMSRQGLLEYEGKVKGREKKHLSKEEQEEFVDAIKKAKQICENFVEEYLFTGKNMAGAIFNLKNNYNWKETIEVEHPKEDKVLKVALEELKRYIRWRKQERLKN